MALILFRPHRGGVEKGGPAPNFTLSSREASVSLRQFRGKVVLLNFWATWCPSCVEEIPSLERLQQSLGTDLELIAVSEDEGGWPAIERFLKLYPVTFRILLDSKGEVADLYSSEILPTTFLIAKTGRVVKEYYGPRNWKDPQIVSEIEQEIHTP